MVFLIVNLEEEWSKSSSVSYKKSKTAEEVKSKINL